MIVYTISLDTSGSEADGRALRSEVDAKLGGSGDPLLVLIHLESVAEARLRYTRSMVDDDREFINAFINKHL